MTETTKPKKKETPSYIVRPMPKESKKGENSDGSRTLYFQTTSSDDIYKDENTALGEAKKATHVRGENHGVFKLYKLVTPHFNVDVEDI